MLLDVGWFGGLELLGQLDIVWDVVVCCSDVGGMETKGVVV